MCYLITATLPPGADADAIQPVATRFGRGIFCLAAAALRANLALAKLVIWPPSTGAIAKPGIARRWGARDETDQKADRYIRLGWSAAKAKRAQAQRDAVAAQRTGSARHAGENDAKRWLDFLRAAVGSGLTPSLGLLLHFYDRGVEEAEFAFGRETVSLSQIDAAALLDMGEEDRLYEFFP